MSNKELANLIFPNIDKTIEDYEKMYPERNLNSNQKVTRFAPSPTGYMHIGGVYQALIDFMLAKNSDGIFYLRNEDTDSTREENDATKLIMKTLKEYEILPDEYEYENEIVGNYGPYVQSERKEIYKKYALQLVESGNAYYSFDTAEELDAMRKECEGRGETFIYNATSRGKLKNSLNMDF